jgi:aconitate hydratase
LFLSSVSDKYGIGFWETRIRYYSSNCSRKLCFSGWDDDWYPDSHTVNAGGLGMFAIGVGGADAVDVMSGMGWE